MSGPAATVVVPTRDHSDVLPRALASVLGQEGVELEVIVVDDGSTDRTRQVVAAIGDARVRYVRQDRRGVSAARNRGAAVARGEVLLFLDSDDEARPGWLRALVEPLEPRAGTVAGVSCCGARALERGVVIEVPVRPLGPAFSDYPGLFLAGTFAVRRELFSAVGGYQEGLAYSENTELALRLLSACRSRGLGVAAVERPLLVIHREAAAPAALTPEQLARRLEASELLLSRHQALLGRDRRLHGRLLATGGVRAARLGDFRRARRLFRAAVAADPAAPRHLMRLLIAGLPPLGRRVWSRAAAAAGDAAERGRPGEAWGESGR